MQLKKLDAGQRAYSVLEVVDMRWEDFGGLRDMEDKTKSEGTMNLYMESEQEKDRK